MPVARECRPGLSRLEWKRRRMGQSPDVRRGQGDEGHAAARKPAGEKEQRRLTPALFLSRVLRTRQGQRSGTTFLMVGRSAQIRRRDHHAAIFLK